MHRHGNASAYKRQCSFHTLSLFSELDHIDQRTSQMRSMGYFPYVGSVNVQFGRSLPSHTHTHSLFRMHASGTTDPMKTGQRELENKGGCRAPLRTSTRTLMYIGSRWHTTEMTEKESTYVALWTRACGAQQFSRPDTAHASETCQRRSAYCPQISIPVKFTSCNHVFLLSFFLLSKAQVW